MSRILHWRNYVGLLGVLLLSGCCSDGFVRVTPELGTEEIFRPLWNKTPTISVAEVKDLCLQVISECQEVAIQWVCTHPEVLTEDEYVNTSLNVALSRSKPGVLNADVLDFNTAWWGNICSTSGGFRKRNRSLDLVTGVVLSSTTDKDECLRPLPQDEAKCKGYVRPPSRMPKVMEQVCRSKEKPYSAEIDNCIRENGYKRTIKVTKGESYCTYQRANRGSWW